MITFARFTLSEEEQMKILSETLDRELIGNIIDGGAWLFVLLGGGGIVAIIASGIIYLISIRDKRKVQLTKKNSTLWYFEYSHSFN